MVLSPSSLVAHVLAVLVVGTFVASCGSQTGPPGPAGPAGPVGPTAAPLPTPTPLPDLLAFSEYVGDLQSSASAITVVNVTNPAAPAIVDTLTMPVCKDEAGNVLTPSNNDTSHGAIDAQDDVVAVQMCSGPVSPTDPNGQNLGNLLVFPYVRGGFGFPLLLFTNVTDSGSTNPGPFEGVAVDGTTLEYGSVDASGNAAVNVATYLPTTTLTPITSIAAPAVVDLSVIAIGASATYFSGATSPQLFRLAPNGIGGVVTQLAGPYAYGMTFDPAGRLWVAQGNSIGVRAGDTGTPIGTISTGTLTNVFGIQFDRAGNLWIANPSDDGTTTTVYGYVAPSATATQLPSPASSFTLPNSVNFVQGTHRRLPASGGRGR